MTVLSVKMDRCFRCYSTVVGCSDFRYIKFKAKMYLRDTKGKNRLEKITKMLSTVVLEVILSKENIGNGWRREIWAEFAKFNTSQRLTEKARMILKKGWFTDLEILEICRRLKCKEYTQRESSKRIESQDIEKQTITEPSTIISILIQERKNVELKKKNEWTKDNITIFNESRVEKSQGRDRKSK